MANIYRVVYVSTAAGNAVQHVSATSHVNALNAAKSADAGFKQVITISEEMHGVTAGS